MRGDFWTIAIRGVFAGWLIALMVWVPPFAGSLRLGSAVLSYLLPTLLGNVVGGVSLLRRSIMRK